MENGRRFFSSAAVLMLAVAITKVIGAAYKIPLGNLLGSAGMAHFYAAYNVYNVLLLLSTAGLPVALSRLVSAAASTGRWQQVRRIFRTALLLLTGIGLIISSAMFFLSKPCSALLHDPMSEPSIRVLAPSVLCICIVSALRGTSQGLGQMRPTAVSQVAESAVKLIVGLALAYAAMRRESGAATAAAGAIAGVTAGSAVALLYLLLSTGRLSWPHATDTPLSHRATARQILHIGLPITLGSVGMSLITLLDQSLTLATLQHALHYSAEQAVTLYGQYTFSLTLFALPASFVPPVCASLMPTIAGAVARGSRAEVTHLAQNGLRLTAWLAFPMGLGLSTLAEPILCLLYPAVENIESSAAHLQILGPASILVCMMILCNSILQAVGRERLPLAILAAGGMVKVAATMILVRQPAINIHGAGISTLLCYGSIFLMEAIAVHCTLPIPVLPSLVAPLLASLVMSIGAGNLYPLFLSVFPAGTALLCTIFIAALLYLLLCLALGGLHPEELRAIRNRFGR